MTEASNVHGLQSIRTAKPLKIQGFAAFLSITTGRVKPMNQSQFNPPAIHPSVRELLGCVRSAERQ